MNTNYLGCDQLWKRSGSRQIATVLPLDTVFIRSEPLVNYLQSLGVAEIQKMIPAINPCTDTVSYAVSGEVLRMPPFWNALVFRFNTKYDIPALAYGLVALFSESILWAQPNFIYRSLESKAHQDPSKVLSIAYPSDTLYWQKKRQEYLRSGVASANVDSAWMLTKGDSAIRIGVVDGGFDYRHPDLGGGVGPGYRVKGAFNYIKPANADDTFTPLLQLTYDMIGHGTKSLSSIGAINNNTLGVAGVCGGDSLHTGTSMYCLAASRTQSVANAVWEASANTGTMPLPGGSGYLWMCDILSFSIATSAELGSASGLGYADEICRQLVAFRYQNGRSTFCAYGNGGHPHILENANTTYAGAPMDVDKEWVIAVGGSFNNRIENKEDWGPNLDVLAPAENWACKMDTTFGYQYTFGTYTNTSAAAPIAAGTGGLLLSWHRMLLDSAQRYRLPVYLAPEDVQGLLEHSAQQSSLMPRNNDTTGWGMIKARRCLELISYPHILRHDSVRVKWEKLPPYEDDILKILNPGWTNKITMQPYDPSYSDATYRVKRYRLSTSINIDRSRLKLGSAKVIAVWGRGGNSLTGYSNPIKLQQLQYRVPLYRVGYCALVGSPGFDQTQANLETYAYKVWQFVPGSGFSPDSAWSPQHPDSVWFTYSVLADSSQDSSQIVSAGESPSIIANNILVHVFPQPANDVIELSIRNQGSGPIDVWIFDVFGRKVSDYRFDVRSSDGMQQVLGLSVSALASGHYHAVISAQGQVPVMKQFLVAR